MRRRIHVCHMRRRIQFQCIKCIIECPVPKYTDKFQARHDIASNV
jgi:hypothetical protein